VVGLIFILVTCVQLRPTEKAQQCGWLKDKYGVSWQIVPDVLDEMLRDKDQNKSERVMKSLLQMKKIDIEKLNRAYKGE
jgi:predicted 3-demethylubiquinone-9 3-methyltransferase (glyoxalase superfamily)